MGTNISQLERDIGTDFPANEHYFGLVNVSKEKWIFSQCFDFDDKFSISVWKHLLFKLSPTGAVFLQTVSGQGSRVQAEE